MSDQKKPKNRRASKVYYLVGRNRAQKEVDGLPDKGAGAALMVAFATCIDEAEAVPRNRLAILNRPDTNPTGT